MTVFKTSVRNFFAHKGRMALSAIAVLLSVAFICGTLVFTDTINATFDKLFASTSADVTISPEEKSDVQNTGRAPTIPVSLLDQAKQVEGAKAARLDASSEQITVVNSKNDSIGSSTGAPTIGTGWRDDGPVVDLTSGHAPHGDHEAVVDADTMHKRHLRIGDPLRILAIPGQFPVKIVGVATFRTTNPGAALVFLETRTVQTKLLGSADVTSRIELDAAPGVTHTQLKKNVIATIGDGYLVQTKAEAAKEGGDDIGGFLDVIKYVMLGFAGIAVLVGIFLIVNTFSMLVARRTRELGLLRAVGASRRQVNRTVLIEALLLGVVGSVLGVGAGVGLAIGLMKLMGQTGMNLDTSELTVKAITPVIGVGVGVIVTVLAAYLPARRAGKVSPMAAMRDIGIPADGKSGKVRAAIGLLFTAAGGVALAGSASADKSSQGGLLLGGGVFLTLLGFVIIGPLLAGVLVRAISTVVLRAFGSVGRMAERNALRNPRRTGATATALMIGLALVAGLSVVGSSLVASATDELDKSVGADFIVASDTGQPITPDIEKAVKDLAKKDRSPQLLDHITDAKDVRVRLTGPDGKRETLNLSATDKTFADDLRVDTLGGRFADAYALNAVAVHEGYAKDHKVKLGDELPVSFIDGATTKLRVAAITSDQSTLNSGAMYISLETAQQSLPNQMPLDAIMFAKAKDGQEKQAYAEIKQALDPYPQVKVRDQADYKKLLEDQVGTFLKLIYGLLALAIVVAVLGVVNTLALSVVERTREIGLMRAIGLSRRQLRRMVRLESVVIALFGALIGLGLGMGWGIAAQKLLELQGLMILEIPWSTIISVFIGAALVGLIAALVPAFRAGRMNVLNAIATD